MPSCFSVASKWPHTLDRAQKSPLDPWKRITMEIARDSSPFVYTHSSYKTLALAISWGPGGFRYQDRWKWFLLTPRSSLNPPGPPGKTENLSFRTGKFRDRFGKTSLYSLFTSFWGDPPPPGGWTELRDVCEIHFHPS